MIQISRCLAALLLFATPAWAGEWVVVEGGLSPNKKLAIAVFPQNGAPIDEANGTVLLIDQVKGRKIGPLEEVSSDGGTWGTTAGNVNCRWSADSSLLIVNYRTGRRMYGSEIYRIEGRRAIPLSLPDPANHPKGKILEALDSGSNPGCAISLEKDGTVLEETWGYRVKSGHEEDDFSKYGLGDFDDRLIFHYRFDKDGQLKIVDVTAPREQ